MITFNEGENVILKRRSFTPNLLVFQEHQERADAAAAKEKAAAKERPPEPHMKPAQPESSTIGPEMPFRDGSAHNWI